jgi:uncharacterized membrane protein YvlD (DUF360 family)
MDVSSHLPGYGKLIRFRGTAMRTGIYVGVCLSLTFVAWLVVANRIPALGQFALQRNIAAAAALAFFGMIPVLRFHAMPGRLWASGVIAWLILSLCYRLFSFFFTGLPERYSAFQVFMLGAVVYTIASTICWIGTIVWRMRAPHIVAGGASHAPIPPSNHRMS